MFEVGKTYYNTNTLENGVDSVFFKVQSRDVDRLYVLEVVECEGVKSTKRKIYDVFKDSKRCNLTGRDDAEYVKYLGVVEISDSSKAFSKFEVGHNYMIIDLSIGKGSIYRVSQRDGGRVFLDDKWYEVKGTDSIKGEYVEFKEYYGNKLCIYAKDEALL